MDNGKGFTKIPNDLLTAIMTYKFTATQLIVVLYVLRQTIGWNKTRDIIAVSKIAKDVGRKRQLISRTVSDLEKLNVLCVERKCNGVKPMLWINDPENWDKPETVQFHVTTGFHETEKIQKVKPYSFRGETEQLHKSETEQFHTKDNKDIYIKDNKDISNSPPSESKKDDDTEWLDADEAMRRWKQKNGYL